MGYGLGQKGYRCFDLSSQKLYVQCHVVFLEHIPFFSIQASSHYLITYYVIKIDPFGINDTTPTFEPTAKHFLAPIIDTAPKVVPVDSPIMLVQSAPKVVSLLNYQNWFIPLILVHLLLLC